MAARFTGLESVLTPIRNDYDIFCAECKKGPPMGVLRNALDTTAAFAETVLEVWCIDCGGMKPAQLVPVI